MSRQSLRVKVMGGDGEILSGPTIWIAARRANGQVLGRAPVNGGVARFVFDRDLPPPEKLMSVSAESSGYLQSGVVGKQLGDEDSELQLLLLPKSAKLQRQGAMPWKESSWPASLAVSDSDFAALESHDPLRAAFVLNLAEALLNVPGGKHLLGALHGFPVIPATEGSRQARQEGVLQDRMLVKAKREIVELLGEGAEKEQWEEVSSAAHGRPRDGETPHSWKENLYDEAGLQFTVFDNEAAGVAYVDIDFDYFRDGVSHFFQEFLPNALFGWRTHPMQVYARRWMQARNFAGEEERVFSPAYRWIG